MSIESDYIINQINQAPKDFKGDESNFIIDKIKQFTEWNKRLRNKQTVTMDLYNKHQDIMNPTIEEFGDGDVGYSIGALRVAASKNIIKPDMSLKEVYQIMERENLIPYGFKLDESILNEVFNPFTKDLPQGDTMNVGDFG